MSAVGDLYDEAFEAGLESERRRFEVAPMGMYVATWAEILTHNLRLAGALWLARNASYEFEHAIETRWEAGLP